MCCNHQDLRGSRDLGRWKNIHGAMGMLDMPLFMGGRAMHAVRRVSSCISLHVSACHRSPLCGTLHEVPTPLNTRDNQRMMATDVMQ